MSDKKHHHESLADFARAGEVFAKFCQTIAALRDPNTGCPWDLEQDHHSLRRYMLEEAYEAFHAMSKGAPKEICEELGDVLLQVVLNAQVAADGKLFVIDDVINSINEKMQRRHPHVFGQGVQVSTPDEVRGQWDRIKESEKSLTQKEAASNPFHELHEVIPATTQALAIGKRARKIKFDWSDPKAVFEQLLSEVKELDQACTASGWKPSADVAKELSDVYFTLAQVCRHFGFDPETVAMDGNAKFLNRFSLVCDLAKEEGQDISSYDESGLERLWQNAKSRE